MARVGQYNVEAAYPLITRSPTTITGAGISQGVIEVAYALPNANARVSQYDVEVAFAMTAFGTGGSVPGPVRRQPSYQLGG